LRNSLILGLVLSAPLWAWDSRTEGGAQIGVGGMHRQYTQIASEFVQGENLREIAQYFNQVEKGCLTELHELRSKDIDVRDGNAVGLNVEAKRVQHRGTNEGCDDIAGWWTDCINAYRGGNKPQAYFIMGIILHMVQDMGVPAHANKLYHQGTVGEFDNFEFNATFNPSYVAKPPLIIWQQDRVNRADPKFADPSRYYNYSRDWAKADAPGYNNRDSYPKTRIWPFWTQNSENLMRDRQARTQAISIWCMRAAMLQFVGRPNPN